MTTNYASKPMTPAMKRCLDDIIAWGEIGPNTEDATGCHGSAFAQVIGGLRARGLLDGKELPTSAAYALYCKADDEIELGHDFQRDATDDERAGIDWWNAIDAAGRYHWLEKARYRLGPTASAADAWAEYKAAEAAIEAERLRRLITRVPNA